MKLHYSKDWHEKSANIEGNSEVGAGTDYYNAVVFGAGQVGRSMLDHAHVCSTKFSVMRREELLSVMNQLIFPNDLFIINTVAATDWQ